MDERPLTKSVTCNGELLTTVIGTEAGIGVVWSAETTVT